MEIAIGVCLGITLFMLVTMWLLPWREKAASRAEIQRMVEYEKRAEPRELARMTPEVLIARCGNPVKDETSQEADVMLNSRTLTYRLSAHRKLLVTFASDEGHSGWRLIGFASLQDKPPFLVNGLMGFDEKAAIRAFPCLSASASRP
jgi:hypothetical protein